MARSSIEIEINERALALTRRVPTPALVESFLATDTMMDRRGITAGERHDLATTRGWIIDVLDERGELALIGLE